MNWRLFLRNTMLHLATALLLAAGAVMVGVPFVSSRPYAALILSVAVMGLLIAAYKPVRRFLQPAIDHFVFADQFSYLEILAELPDDLLEFTNLREMLEFSIAQLTEVAKLERVRVFMHDPGHQTYVEMIFRGASRNGATQSQRPVELSEKAPLIQWLRAESRLWTEDELRRIPKFAAGSGLSDLKGLGGAAIFPISKEEDLLGLVILGPKRSGEPFHPHDLKILRSLRRSLENFLTQAMVLTQEALNMVKDSHDMKNDVNALKGRISWRSMRLSSWWLDFEREIGRVEQGLARKGPGVTFQEREALLESLALLKRGSSEFYADTRRALPIEENAITRMAHHLRNWAEFGRVVAEGFRGRRPQETVNVGQTAQLSVDRWKPMADKKNILLSAEVSGTLFIRGEGSLLGQILDNLIDNAVKATENGSVRVVSRQEQNEILIEVKDSGLGIEPADLVEIFDKPFSHGRSRDKLDQGTGVGLYLAALYTRSLGGRILAESEIGKGSTFRVVLPVSHPEPKPSEAAA